MRSVAARTSLNDACVRSGATRPRLCSSCPAATSSGSIQGVASFMVWLLVLLSGAGRLGGKCRCGRGQARQHLLGKEPDAFLGLLVVEKARAADEDEMAETADLVVNLHDLVVDRIRVAGAKNAAGDRLLGGDADQAVGGASHRLRARPRLGAIVLRRDLRRHPAWQKFRHLRRLLEAGVEEPQGLAADPHSFLIGVADIA